MFTDTKLLAPGTAADKETLGSLTKPNQIKQKKQNKTKQKILAERKNSYDISLPDFCFQGSVEVNVSPFLNFILFFLFLNLD